MRLYTEDKKRILRQYDILQQNKKQALLCVIRNAIILAALLLFCGGAGTGVIVAAFTETNGFAALIILFVVFSLLFWAIPIVGGVFLIRSAIPYIALLQGKYVFEIDRAKFSTPREYHIKHSVFTLHVTQFEKHGAFELGNPPRMGQEFYVLATTTKKPRIIALYDTDKFEITQR